MAGTREGGLKAAATNKLLHGEDFYVRLGKKGGRNGHTGGFASNNELARRAGSRGGRISRRYGHAGPQARTRRSIARVIELMKLGYDPERAQKIVCCSDYVMQIVRQEIKNTEAKNETV